MMTTDQLANWFTYHEPTEEQKPKYKAIRDDGVHPQGPRVVGFGGYRGGYSGGLGGDGGWGVGVTDG